MAKLGGTKFTWVIKNLSSLQFESKTRYSDTYDIANTGYNCSLAADRKPNQPGCLFLYIFYGPSSPTGRRRCCVKYRLTMVNQLSKKLSIYKEGMQFFYPLTIEPALASVIFLLKFHDKDDGFQVNDEVKIVVEVDVLEDVPMEPEMESIDVNGFHVFPSQVGTVRRIFEKHPDIAVDFRAKNQHVRSACMSSLLGLIETLCKSLHELSNEDLIEADIALKYVKAAGFKVDWLGKNLEQVREKKKKELSDLALLQETEKKALNKKRKFEKLDALAEEMKKKLSATRTPLSFDDVV